MKASNKEKALLGILLTAFISVMYYQFIYLNQVEKLNIKKSLKAEKEEEYNTIIQTINGIEKKKSDIKILNDNILGKSSKLYPAIIQEKIIIELDGLLTASGLKGNIAFSPIEVASVPLLTAPLIQKPESSLKPVVNDYKNNEKENSETTTEGNGKEEGTTNNSTNTSVNAGQAEPTATSEQLKVGISFNGSYDELKRFIELLETNSRKITITNIAITPISEVEVTGSMNIEFYGVPKLTDEDAEYLLWTLNNTYGKESPFAVGAANGAYNSSIEQSTSQTDINDFIMMLRSPASDLPTLTLGKAKDSDRKTYVYSDNSKIEEVEIEFKEDAGNIYYTYRTASTVYPKDNTGLGEEFKAHSEKVTLEVLSEARVGTNDTSGIKLKVKNNTTKTVEIIIKNDDITYPRIDVSSEGNSVNVIKR